METIHTTGITIVLPVWFVWVTVIYMVASTVLSIIEALLPKPKKEKIILTYKEFKDFQDQVKFKDSIKSHNWAD